MMKCAITLILGIVTLGTASAFAETPVNRDVGNPVHAEHSKHGTLALLTEVRPGFRPGNDFDRPDLTLQVIDAYYRTVMAEKLLRVVDESCKALEPTESLSVKYYNGGVVSRCDVLWLRARLALTRLERARLQLDMELSRADLRRLLGYSFETPIKVDLNLDYVPNSYKIPGIYEIAVARRPDMRAAKITKKEVLSMVSASGRGERASGPPETEKVPAGENSGIQLAGTTKPMTLSEALTISLEKADRNRSASVDSASQEEMPDPRRQLISNILQEVKTAYLTMKSSENSIINSRKAVVFYTENFRINAERYKEQVTYIQEVVECHRLLVRARFAHVRSLAAYRINVARLEKTLGILGAKRRNLEDK